MVGGQDPGPELGAVGASAGPLPEGAAAVMAAEALALGGVSAVADDVLALTEAAGDDLDDHVPALPRRAEQQP